MSSHSPTSSTEANIHTQTLSNKHPVPGKSSVHHRLLELMAPDWLVDATPQRRASMKYTNARLPDWYQQATAYQQQVLTDSFNASFTAQTRLDKTMSLLQDIDTFAAPILAKALKDQFGVEVDVSKTMVCLRRPLEIGDLEIEVSTFEVMKLTLLQAALHNFEESECEEGAFHRSSGFVVETSTPATFEVVSVNMTTSQFLSLCRTLDIGAQYQAHMNGFFHPAQVQKETTLREQFIASQKTAMRAAAELALLKRDIEPQDYSMILAVIDGEVHPWLGDRQVWFCDLSLMKRRMTGCVVFGICEKYRYTNDFIVYVPHDPEHPLKRYTSSQMREEFKRQFTARGTSSADGSTPTAHQRFFSQFVAYADRPYYFSQFTRKTADSPSDPLRSIWVKVAQFIPPLSTLTRIKELPPERQGKREPVEDPYLDPHSVVRQGAAGIWAANTDLWTYLYEQNRAKVIADARSHAVPTADVDAKVRAEKLNHLLEIGMLGLNLVSMFVPVLGEVMLTVMAGQLLYESFEGVIEWSEGDRNAAKAHLIDVAENLAQIAVMAGVGKGVGKLAAVKPEPMIEGMEQIQRANGDTRLWKPDLRGYESDVTLGREAAPDASGQYRVDGKTYVRQNGKHYETTYDESLKKWRINHPTDEQAWQPILEHNGHGAWRHTLERPLGWDRLTLLRRMGHITDGVSDAQLLQIADVSGVNDNTLRRMHMDHLPPPPELLDALRLFKADPGVTPVIEQAGHRQSIGRLQRACPGLSESAAKRVLLDASAEELARLNSTRRIPLRMLEEARRYAQKGRTSQAFAGLHMENMASADSQWLALRALEKLPGWSGDVRLEIRDGHIRGPLINGIGSETAATRRYVVKQGPAFQAFDERGMALNRVPGPGASFFDSIMHALPDESRQALGVPHVWQSAELQKAIIDSAGKHRAELAQLLQKRVGSNRRFKPPVRVTERTVGYYASGRGQGTSPSLATRVQDLYPGLTNQQANGFILRRWRPGKTDAQIYDLLQARMREWDELQTTLDEWVGGPAADPVLQSMLGGKTSAARNIKQCWRNSPLAEELPQSSSLELVCDEPLPSLTADFSHVRELNVRGRCITDANVDALLANFPGLKKLRINATNSEFTKVPQALSGMRELTALSLYSSAPVAADMTSGLSSLTKLEELSIYSSGFAPMNLDVSQMRNLRKLEVVAPSLLQWPAGVLELPHLERLNLKGTGISRLPNGIYEGHEKLWSGLSLDWSLFLRENFKPAYEYVKNHPEHLVDQEEMVSDYCKGELIRLDEGRVSETSRTRFNSFLEQWQGAEPRFKAVDAISEEFNALERQLNGWSNRAQLEVKEFVGRSWTAASIKACWRNGVFKRYGLNFDVSVLDLSNPDVNELPELPAGAFPHVQTLNLRMARVPAEQFRGFVRGFSKLESLDLRGNGLTDVPVAAEDLAKLTRLDLSDNRIVVSPAIQQAFEGMGALESLDLSGNPLNSLDVSAMTSLKTLNLRATQLHEWPVGAQDLPQLIWMDLRDSRISSLPVTLQDEVLLKTDLTGTPLNPQAVTALKGARQRIESAKGLAAGSLERFAREQAPSTFPPKESSYSISRHLLPLPPVPMGEGSVHFARRLQRLKPTLADDDALRVIEQMRENGATDVQISERFDGWDQTFEALTRRLNGWLFTRESHGEGWIVSSESRRAAALRIMECWREGLTDTGAVTGSKLDFNGLQLGDLPELPEGFSHVDTLSLTGVRLTAQGSNGFFSAFAKVKTLELNGNELQYLPEPIQSMDQLERLELSTNRLSDSGHLYTSLSHLEHLQWLDLGYNDLETFDVTHFERLETLDLRRNDLTAFPEGVLEARHLRTLNLSGNDITTIAPEALDNSHEALMAGTDLSDNHNLSPESLEFLRDYRERGWRDTVLGISRSELDEMMAEPSDDSESESAESDEDLSDVGVESAQKTPWLSDASSEESSRKSQIWNRLVAEPDNAAFFHLLSRLQDTQEFRVAKADLTRRVWTVLEAAASNSELREVLFASSSTHGTCVDGRILTFSGLESKVFTHNALLDIPVGRPAAKGVALLKLSRQLFRLDKVDDLATKAATHGGQDQAEVRLGYRIGLTGGWSDGLELPGQPRHMTYASGVTPQQLADARIQVSNAEQSDGFFEDLIQRDYWVDYLKEKYPQEFRQLDEADAQEVDDTDSAALDSYLFDLLAARNSKMIELSRKEVEEMGQSASGAGQPGTSRDLPRA
ncbi:leucine rich repeat family protein [Pseudomonas fluorescens]|uniref:RING-type E3 ubiquitin transferase n=1 Tax=Pseudomonas fluorescens TaxID=294 RepID=A0A0P8ZTJ7_PSEFL|nr:NEL-type E3 ubiquitin ligase domain-containing protein [Pseudomonas fluorescens]KPU60636.1 leucine rich repeat family protein [Pseudomonas fluorescens]